MVVAQAVQVGAFGPESSFRLAESCPTTPRPQCSPAHHSLPTATRIPSPRLVAPAMPLACTRMRVSDGETEKKKLSFEYAVYSGPMARSAALEFAPPDEP